jgi:hypothetical protein
VNNAPFSMMMSAIITVTIILISDDDNIRNMEPRNLFMTKNDDNNKR